MLKAMLCVLPSTFKRLTCLVTNKVVASYVNTDFWKAEVLLYTGITSLAAKQVWLTEGPLEIREGGGEYKKVFAQGKIKQKKIMHAK